jgi:ankyrin repeat protein
MWPFKSQKYQTVAKAVHAGDVRAVKEMLERGDDPNSYDPEYKAYAIHFAIGRLSWETSNHEDDAKIIKLLVDHGANVNIPSGGKLPLWVAEAGGHREVAAILRRSGAQLRVDEDKFSMPPAKEREIRKVAREYAHKLRMIRPDYTNEQLAEAVESKIIVRPDQHISSEGYSKFKEEMQSIIREVVGD